NARTGWIPANTGLGSKPPPDLAAYARKLAPVLRGAIAYRRSARELERFVSEFRSTPQILNFVAAPNLAKIAQRGVSTPDLSIRIKTGPMVLPALEAMTSESSGKLVRERVARFAADYTAYFSRNNTRVG